MREHGLLRESQAQLAHGFANDVPMRRNPEPNLIGTLHLMLSAESGEVARWRLKRIEGSNKSTWYDGVVLVEGLSPVHIRLVCRSR